ncbi:MAG: helix-turn-helix transcriptional regulator [Actinomycetaceae bacterium]|nr:helix-turn-helix transcriptional regulator [Actinomycetaceae bacterium]
MQRASSIKAKREQVRRDDKLRLDLVAHRRTVGLEQSDIAQRLSVDQSTISRFENGKVNPTQQFIRRYAQAVGVEIHYEIRSIAIMNDELISSEA